MSQRPAIVVEVPGTLASAGCWVIHPTRTPDIRCKVDTSQAIKRMIISSTSQLDSDYLLFGVEVTLAPITVTCLLYTKYVSATENVASYRLNQAIAGDAVQGTLVKGSQIQRFLQVKKSTSYTMIARLTNPTTLSWNSVVFNSMAIKVTYSGLTSATGFECFIRKHDTAWGVNYDYLYTMPGSCVQSGANVVLYTLSNGESYAAGSKLELVIIPVVATNNFFAQPTVNSVLTVNLYSDQVTISHSRLNDVSLYQGPSSLALSQYTITDRGPAVTSSIFLSATPSLTIPASPAGFCFVELPGFVLANFGGTSFGAYDCGGAHTCTTYLNGAGVLTVAVRLATPITPSAPLQVSFDLFTNPTLAAMTDPYFSMDIVLQC